MKTALSNAFAGMALGISLVAFTNIVFPINSIILILISFLFCILSIYFLLD